MAPPSYLLREDAPFTVEQWETIDRTAIERRDRRWSAGGLYQSKVRSARACSPCPTIDWMERRAVASICSARRRTPS